MGHLANVLRSVLVNEGGVAGNDEKIRVFGQLGDQIVGHAVGEVFLLRVSTQVVERQDGDGSGHRASARRSLGRLPRAEVEQRGGCTQHYDNRCNGACPSRQLSAFCLGSCALRRRLRLCGLLQRSDGGHQPIALLGDSLDDPRMSCVIVYSLAQLQHGAGQRVVADDPTRPQLRLDLFAGDDLARSIGKVDENVHHPGFQLGGLAALPDATGGGVHPPVCESERWMSVHSPKTGSRRRRLS